MCPACLASLAIIAASTTAVGGGLAAFVLRKLHLKSLPAKPAASKRQRHEHRP